MKKTSVRCALIALVLVHSGCTPPVPRNFRIPSVEYSAKVKRDVARRDPEYRAKLIREEGFNSPSMHQAVIRDLEGPRAQMGSVHRVDGVIAGDVAPRMAAADVLTNDPTYESYESAQPLIRDYRGPLNLGDPGVSSSLWKESRGGSDLFRDYRAWQPMDLITIVVSENTEGKKEADTEVKQDSSISAAIQNFFGLEAWSKIVKTDIDLNNLVNATTQSDFKGEGETTRKGSLRARMSAMVVEVLPSGVLRIEGEKIISLNSEDETMVISGLVRPEDVSSNNEVDSSKVANVRIDYYGQGTLGDAQRGGWMGRMIRRLWPF